MIFESVRRSLLFHLDLMSLVFLHRNLSVHFLICLDDTLTAFSLIETLPFMSLPLLIIFRNEIYSKKGLNQFRLSSKFLGFQGFLMNTETMAPQRYFTKKIFLTFVSLPFRISCFSVDHSKSTSLWFAWQPHPRG